MEEGEGLGREWSLRSGRDLEEGRSLWGKGRDLEEGRSLCATMTSPLESPHASLPGPQPFLSLQDEWALLDLPAGSDSLLPLCTLHHPKVQPCVPGLPQAQPLPELVEFSGQGLSAWPQAWPHP